MQYPAARCSMGPNICMYGHSASSGAESMNNANNLARQKAAVDILNAAIKTIQLEGETTTQGSADVGDGGDGEIGRA